MQGPNTARPSFGKASLTQKRGAQKRRLNREDYVWGGKAALLVLAVCGLIAFVVESAWGDILGVVLPGDQGWKLFAAIVVGLAIGWLLAFFKRKFLSVYAIVELMFAAVSIAVGTAKLLYSVGQHDDGGQWTAGVTLVGALYLASRAFANHEEAAKKRWEPVQRETRAELLDDAIDRATRGNVPGAFERVKEAMDLTE